MALIRVPVIHLGLMEPGCSNCSSVREGHLILWPTDFIHLFIFFFILYTLSVFSGCILIKREIIIYGHYCIAKTTNHMMAKDFYCEVINLLL